MSWNELTRRISFKAVLFIAILFVFGATKGREARGQSVTDGATPGALKPGAPAGSYQLSGLDNVNLFNGNLNFRLPLITAGGRGSVGTSITLLIERHWRVDHEPMPSQCPTCTLDHPIYDEWVALPGYSPGRMDYRVRGEYGEPCSSTSFGDVYIRTTLQLTFTAPDGTEYDLRDTAQGGRPLPNGSCGTPSRGRVFVTADGSAMTFVSDAAVGEDQFGYVPPPTGYLMLRDGTVYRVSADNPFSPGLVRWVRDRNGNKITFGYNSNFQITGITDPLGRTIGIEYNVNEAPFGLIDRITYKGFGGVPRYLRVGKAWLHDSGMLRQTQPDDSAALKTPAELFPELNGANSQGPFDLILTSAVWLPDGRAYRFRYNVYGELARVELPTGGAVEYDYWAGDPSALSGASGVINGEIYRRVMERRVYPDGVTLEGKSTYSRPPFLGADSAVDMEQWTPAGARITKSTHYFYGKAEATLFRNLNLNYTYGSWKEGREYKTEEYAENGTTLLRKVENTWRQRAAVSWWQSAWGQDEEPSNDPRLVETITTLTNTNQVSKKTAINPQTGAVGFDQYNNPTDVWEYDFGVGAAPQYALRHTHTDYETAAAYVNADPNPALGASLRSLPRAQRVYSVNPSTGAETIAAKTETRYDESAYSLLPCDPNSVVPCSSVPQWADPGTSARGNATSVRSFVNAAASADPAQACPAGVCVETHARYDQLGNLRYSWDARNNKSEVIYGDSFCNGTTCGTPTYTSNTFAFAVSTKTPKPDPSGAYGSATELTASTVYDFYTGRTYSATDANNKTTLFGYENQPAQLDRLKSVVRPDGGRTDFYYGDTVGSLYVRTLTDLDASRRTEARHYLDGLGRGVRAFSWENQDAAEPWLTADTQYDALGRAWRGSNQYRSTGPGSDVNPSGRWTETTFDALGRAKQVKTTADGAYVTMSYNGNAVTVTDQHDSASQGHKRRSITDALGRLSRVDEPDASSGNLDDQNGNPIQPTYYTYGVLDNLRVVTQGTQTRTFLYDSLGRLTGVTNPESGALSYTYDNDGNLLTKTDARGVTITYAYDALNRNTTTDYSDTAAVNPDIRRYYDTSVNGKGRYNGFCKGGDCTTGANVEHTSIDSFDVMGRPLVKRQLFKTNGAWSPTYRVELTYDEAGNVLTEKYPSNHTVNYNYDAAGRPGDNGAAKAFSGNLGDGVARTYDSEVRYHETGGREQERFGTDTPVYNKALYNGRGQLAEIRLSTYAYTEADPNLKTNWNRGAIINHYSHAPGAWGATGGGPDNNGNLQKQEIYLPDNDLITGYANVVQQYSYDSLNRLNSVYDKPNNGTPDFIQGYTYDRWGNRTIDQTLTTSNVPKPQYTASAATNRLSPPAGFAMTYDAAGNLTYDDYYGGGGARTYDAENRMTSAQFVSGVSQTATYTYDGEGRRTRRKAGAGGEVWQVYGFGGELLAEYAANAASNSPQNEYGYVGGKLLVTAKPAQISAETYRASTDFSNAQGQRGWYYLDSTGAQMTFDAATSRWRGAETYNLIWANGNHPGGSADSVRQWRAPGAGTVRITGSASDANVACGDGVLVTIKKGAQVLWQQTINNGNSAGLSYDITTSVAAADQINFVVNRRSEYGCDSTNFDPTITFTGSAPTGQVSWLVSDQLGTPRMVVDRTGSLAGVRRHDYLPFGEEVAADSNWRTTARGYVGDSVRQKFTGSERDGESGLDYMQARYYSSTAGRFTSPDKPFADQRETNPQSWNLYAYVRNNPCNNTDPSGRCSAPSGLKEGSVGICIEAFIAAPKIGPGGIALGDNRGFDGNNKDLTSRVRVDVILTATKQRIDSSTTATAGVSEIITSVNVVDRDKTTGQMDVIVSKAGIQGTASAKSDVVSTDAIVGKEGFGSNTILNVSGTGTNGFQAAGTALSMAPVTAVAAVGKLMEAASPAGSIDFNVTFKISGNGDVVFTGGESRGYPSYAAYSYRYENGKLVTTELFRRQENKIEDLTNPQTPITK